jgi:hypothetical protein
MKRGTKAAVFIASMALTTGSLIAFIGPRHYGHWGNHRQCGKENYNSRSCGDWNHETDQTPASSASVEPR